MLTKAFEAYAQSLRILLEAVLKSHSLIMVDPHEASGNIEQGFTTVLNAFHSLYDNIRLIPEIEFDWYGVPETATILALRNARHHNFANKIRGLYAYHLEQDEPEKPVEYLILDYLETEDGGKTFETLVSWGDIDEMLSLPNATTKLRNSVVPKIRDYLYGDLINSYVDKFGIGKTNIFVNVTPLIVNASMKIVPIIKQYVTPRSTEAKHFIHHFENVFPADTGKHEINNISVFLSV